MAELSPFYGALTEIAGSMLEESLLPDSGKSAEPVADIPTPAREITAAVLAFASGHASIDVDSEEISSQASDNSVWRGNAAGLSLADTAVEPV